MAVFNLPVGHIVQLTALVRDQNNNPMTYDQLGDNPSRSTSPVWSSNNTAVATVNSKGSVKGVTAGNATLTAEYEDNNGNIATQTIDVVVYPQEATTIEILFPNQ